MEPLIAPRDAFPDVQLGQPVTILGKKYIAVAITGEHFMETLEIIPGSQMIRFDPA